MTRLFVAVWPSDDVLSALDELERPKDTGVRWVPRENLHVTLRFLGDADEHAVSDAIDTVVLSASTARLGPAVDVRAERSLMIPVDGIDELAATITRATRGLGTERERRHYVGHLTVARLARGARPARSIGRRFSARFDVTEIALVASTLAADGARYETVATWPTR